MLGKDNWLWLPSWTRLTTRVVLVDVMITFCKFHLNWSSVSWGIPSWQGLCIDFHWFSIKFYSLTLTLTLNLFMTTTYLALNQTPNPKMAFYYIWTGLWSPKDLLDITKLVFVLEKVLTKYTYTHIRSLKHFTWTPFIKMGISCTQPLKAQWSEQWCHSIQI